MDLPTIIAKALASAVIGNLAKDAYEKVKELLKSRFGLGRAVEAIEENPSDPTEQDYMARKISDSGALEDPDFSQKVQMLLEAIRAEQSPPAAADILLRDIRANHDAIIEQLKARGNASVTVENVQAGGSIRIRDITADGS